MMKECTTLLFIVVRVFRETSSRVLSNLLTHTYNVKFILREMIGRLTKEGKTTSNTMKL